MSYSHICLRCGRDNARVAPRLDPFYTLPLVACAGCGARSVRRRHPLSSAWRRLKRIDLALSALFIQTIFAAGCVVGIVLPTNLLAHFARAAGTNGRETVLEAFGLGAGALSLAGDDAFVLAVQLLINSAVAGVWLTATLAHTRVLSRWSLFAVPLVAGASIEPLLWLVARPIGVLLLQQPVPFPALTRAEWLLRLEFLAIALGVMALMTPVGLGVRVLIRWTMGALWRRQLRRERRARRGADS